MTNQSNSAQPLPTRFDEEVLWQAVLHRDRASNGKFVYAVRSTRIYCRPSCASRRPNRMQVVFFESGEVAQRAGFRACRRCRPDNASDVDPQTQIVQRARQLLDADDAEGAISLSALGSALGVSPYHLQRTFKQVMGVTPRQYADNRRLASFKQNVKSGDKVTAALYNAGYGSSSRLYEKAQSLPVHSAAFWSLAQSAESAPFVWEIRMKRSNPACDKSSLQPKSFVMLLRLVPGAKACSSTWRAGSLN